MSKESEFIYSLFFSTNNIMLLINLSVHTCNLKIKYLFLNLKNYLLPCKSQRSYEINIFNFTDV